MFFYFIIWFVIGFFSFLDVKSSEAKFFYLIFIVFLFLVTGFRYQVGADWFNYIEVYDIFYNQNLKSSLLITDPGYGLLNYISQNLNIKEMWFINSLCAFFFYLCFYKVSIKFKNLWLSLLITFSVTILTVTMGYTRQSVAIGFSLLAFTYLLDKKLLLFILCTVCAFLFHKSAIVLFSLIPIVLYKNILTNKIIFYIYSIVVFIILTVLLYWSSLDGSNVYTVQGEAMSSTGTLFRWLIHLLPLTYFFFYGNILKRDNEDNYLIYKYLTLLVFYILFLSFGFSTLADRFNLYLVIYDVFILGTLYSHLNNFDRKVLLFLIFFFHSLVLFFWFNFGIWSVAWVPYQNYLSNYIVEFF